MNDLPRCAICHRAVQPEEFAGRDAQGHVICTLCEEWLALRHQKQEWAVEALVAVLLTILCTLLAWAVWG